jgi:HNH endonuclease
MECELCGDTHNGTYGSGRFCSSKCARSFSTKSKRNEINHKVSRTLKNRFLESPKVGKPKWWRPSAHNAAVEGSTPSPTTMPRGIGKTESERFFVQLIKDGVLSISITGECFNNKTKRKIGASGSGGYPKLTMSKGSKAIYHIQIHRLVWIVYEGDVPNGLIINHKDLNKSNPSLSNLEVVTIKGNVRHAEENGVTGHRFDFGNTFSERRKTVGNRHKKGIPMKK